MTYKELKQLEIVNWIIEPQLISNDKLAGRRTAEEAIEHFKLDTKPANIESWMRKFGVGKKQTLALAKKNYSEATIRHIAETEEARGLLIKRGLKKLVDGKDLIINDKAMKAMNDYKKAIDNFTGVEDLKVLLGMNLDDSTFKLKKTESKYKNKLTQLEIQIKEKDANKGGDKSTIADLRKKYEL